MLDFGSSLTSVAEYAMLMRIPLLTGAILIALPFLAKLPGLRALLLGLFDVTPPSIIAVTLAATSVAAIVVDNSRVIYLHSVDRGVGGIFQQPPPVPWPFWVIATALLSLPVIIFTVKFSNDQNPGDLWARISYALSTLAGELLVQHFVVESLKKAASRFDWYETKNMPGVLGGYWPMKDHIAAAAGFALALVFYVSLGLYGYTRLGKKATVPALCSALMVMMMACSTLSALSFFLDLWHVPLLLVLIVAGVVTAQSNHSDHYYELKERPHDVKPAPTPIETLRATKRMQNGRIVVVAANGGGIQAAAWTAHVLEQLGHLSPGFRPSLRLISSVSGGSLGSVCYTYWLARGAAGARRPSDSAARSSLDEVAWGLGWPDLMSSLFPWGTKRFVGRGRALERAWVANCATPEDPTSLLDLPLSRWNDGVISGDLPAVIMNATIVESGQRLLFGTTRFSETENCRARVDATTLHGRKHDVPAVTAARLSASFPYVTPAARSFLHGAQPHVVDGGYYDNYGMSTLVEWLDEALVDDEAAGTASVVESVLVIQIHGSPVAKNSNPREANLSNRGWFFQILAPLLTLNKVRGAGQIAHNDLELEQLQQKWFAHNVPIHTVTMEFPDQDAPLSWHLTRLQKENIIDRWDRGDEVKHARDQIIRFLDGSDKIECHCPTCNQQVRELAAGKV